MRLSGGREKARLDRNSSQRDTRVFNALLVSATNVSLLDLMMQQKSGTEAGALRIFECEIFPSPLVGVDGREMQIQQNKLQSNYGHAGEAYAQYLSANKAAVEKTIDSVYRYLQTRLGLTDKHRFWLNMMAIVVTGASIANHLGLAKFDETSMIDYMAAHSKDSLDRIAEQVSDLSAPDRTADLIQQLMSDLQNRHMYVTDFLPVANGRVQPITSRLNGAALERITKPWAHLADQQKLLRVAVPELRDWLVVRKINHSLFIRDLITKHGALKVKRSIGAGLSGTEAQVLQRTCLDIDLNRLNIQIP